MPEFDIDWGSLDAGEGAYVPDATAADPAWGSLDAGPAADPVDTYLPDARDFFQRFTGVPAATPVFTGGAAGDGPVVDGKTPTGTTAVAEGKGVLDSVRSFLGFSDDAKGKNAFATTAATLAAGAIQGLGAGYLAEQKRKIDKTTADNQKSLIDSQIALNNAKTTQNLSTFRVNTPGLIGQPYKTATLTPVTTRA